MIVRTCSGRMPCAHADPFYRHLLATGVADCRRQPVCADVQVWRHHDGERTRFLLVSWWRDRAALVRYAGSDPDVAVLYDGDERYGLVPDTSLTHFELVPPHPSGGVDPREGGALS